MPKRRAHGEGTIVRRRDGRWAGALVVGRDPSGRVVRRWVYGKTRQEVVARLDGLRLRRRITGPAPASDRMTLEHYMRSWLADVAAPAVRPKTLSLYRLATDRIVQVLGRVRLGDLGPHHVQHLMRVLEEEGVGARSRQVVYSVLRAALNHAKRTGLLDNNPVSTVRPPRVPVRPMHVWSAEEARRFLEVARGDRFFGVYALALSTGLRQGEILGLTWDCVDLRHGNIRIVHQLQDLHGDLVLTEPKSSSSRRTIPLPPLALEALRRRKEAAEQEGTFRPDAPVFCDTRGGFMRPSNLLRRSFYPLLERAGVERIRFHDMRHTAATLALQEGVHPRVVADLLGHSRVTLTLSTYSHVLPTLARHAVDAISRSIAGDSDNNLTT
jgi:integrase